MQYDKTFAAILSCAIAVAIVALAAYIIVPGSIDLPSLMFLIGTIVFGALAGRGGRGH